MTNFNPKDQPDFGHPLSRFNAGYWARVYGIMAALGPTDAALLETLYAHLPNVEPGKARLAAMAGISESSVKRGRRRLREVGLVGYADDLYGGLKDETTLYTVTDIRRPEIAAVIVARLTGVTVTPAQDIDLTAQDTEPKILSGGHSDPRTGVTMTPQGVHHEPRTGVTTTSKVHKGSAQPSTKSKTKAAASPPPAVADAPAWVPALRVDVGSGDAIALEASPAEQDELQVADAVKVVEPASALPLPVSRIPELVAAPVGLAALHPDSLAFLAGVISEQEAKAGTAAPKDDQDEGEADAGDEFEELNEWGGEVAADWEEDQDEVEADAVAA